MIYKRRNALWYKFRFAHRNADGSKENFMIRRPAKVRNRKDAKDVEREHRRALSLGQLHPKDPWPKVGRGVVTVWNDTHKVERSGRFWTFAHYSKHVRRGAKVFQTDGLASNAAQASNGQVSHVGFSNPDGSHVVVLANTGQQTRTQLVLGTSALDLDLAADSLYTVQWS